MEEFYSLASGIANATVITLGLFFLLQPLVFSRLMLIYVAVIVLALLFLARVARRMAQAMLRARGVGIQRVLIVGAGDVGRAVLRTMIARPELGYQPIGYVDEDPESASTDLGRVKALGSTKNLSRTLRNFYIDLRNFYIDLVVITLPWARHDRILEIVKTCRLAGVDVRVVPDVQLNLRQVQVENLDGIPLIGVQPEVTFNPRNHLLKRVIDVGLIVIFSPLILLVSGLVALAIRPASKAKGR